MFLDIFPILSDRLQLLENYNSPGSPVSPNGSFVVIIDG